MTASQKQQCVRVCTPGEREREKESYSLAAAVGGGFVTASQKQQLRFNVLPRKRTADTPHLSGHAFFFLVLIR